jgi:tetratricopeptide (TPR) repeat protein
MAAAAALLVPACSTKDRQAKSGSNSGQAIMDSTNIGVLDSLIRQDPKNPDLFAKRAKIQASKKNYQRALNDITIALKMDSLKPEYYVNQAEYFIFSGEPNSAKKGLTACLKRFPNNTDVMLKLAEIHLYMKEYSQAKIVLNDILPINDELGQIYFLQGVIALENNDSTGAARYFQTTIEKEPAYYAAYIQAGKIYAAKHNDLAIQYLKSAIDLQPDSYEARYELATYYQDHGYLNEAEQEYDYIISKIDSMQPYPYYNRGYIEMVYKHNYPEAINWFSRAIEKKADYAEAWYNRGFSHELDGKLSRAKEDYKKATELQPNFPLAIKGMNRIDEGKPIKLR